MTLNETLSHYGVVMLLERPGCMFHNLKAINKSSDDDGAAAAVVVVLVVAACGRFPRMAQREREKEEEKEEGKERERRGKPALRKAQGTSGPGDKRLASH